MKRLIVPLIVLALVAGVYVVKGPYVWPATVALGPCLTDLTSPNSWAGERQSPMRTLDFRVGDFQARLCYGSPSARGRELFGDGVVPYNGRLWRMGANEPTRLFLGGEIRLGDLRLGPGRYSIYAVPDSAVWTVHVTESTWHWGNQISSAVRGQEIGSFEVEPAVRAAFEERLVFRFEDDSLAMHWGTLVLRMPMSE